MLLHGGPGAPGYLAPVARELSDTFRVIEPFQRRRGHEPLTVAGHVADLHRFIQSHCGSQPPAIVGHSWGAMLALAYAASNPDDALCLALVGCGTFDLHSRACVQKSRDQKMTEELRRQMQQIQRQLPDPDERLRAIGRVMTQVDSCDLIAAEDEMLPCDARGFQETWQDMLQQQHQGVYPAAFAGIHMPVIMLHGAVDPHPGPMIRSSLSAYLPQLEYHEWQKCGHYPWLEKSVRDEFYTVLRKWLLRRCQGDGDNA